MTEVGSYEAKTHLAQLLERAAMGERIIITKHGVPMAALTPVDPAAKRNVAETIAKLKKFGKRRSLRGLSARELIEEGRRF